MKKILIFLTILMVIVIIAVGIGVALPNMSGTYRLGSSRMKMEIPYSYEQLDEATENTIINLYNEDSKIKISAIELKKDFWGSGDAFARVEEYLNVISAINYDSNIKNIKKDTIANLNNKVGRVEVEVENPGGSFKTITIIPNEEVGNIVLEFMGDSESIEKNMEEIEEIINSIKI